MTVDAAATDEGDFDLFAWHFTYLDSFAKG
jgi:hypothetical protein